MWICKKKGPTCKVSLYFFIELTPGQKTSLSFKFHTRQTLHQVQLQHQRQCYNWTWCNYQVHKNKAPANSERGSVSFMLRTSVSACSILKMIRNKHRCLNWTRYLKGKYQIQNKRRLSSFHAPRRSAKCRKNTGVFHTRRCFFWTLRRWLFCTCIKTSANAGSINVPWSVPSLPVICILMWPKTLLELFLAWFLYWTQPDNHRIQYSLKFSKAIHETAIHHLFSSIS